MTDFEHFLEEIGLTQGQMDAAASRMPPPLPRGDGEPYFLYTSSIHGVGCFATSDVDGLICRLREGEGWYEAGRYINHSDTPNTQAVIVGTVLMASGSVRQGDEITLDYRQVRSLLGEHHG